MFHRIYHTKENYQTRAGIPNDISDASVPIEKRLRPSWSLPECERGAVLE